ncbi:hypothetical protein FZI91_14510 [Mycobacterium sp. CBMA271]|uniref:DUF7373 family lipoprotein n=1 Tax=unclassified Mycobacteroides TaxID=2618759 RepID=UPI0012DDB97A|nr:MULTISPECIES: hypothetical protein [unclassified Mycobacteroides]MUM16700.1 hypothetical protein [Mycobacteroides sp. CBMA 326]MUM22911.1 hypothetical protein [Mycobacteroides sp. CBMA 271]
MRGRVWLAVAIVLVSAACGPPPAEGIEIVTNGETPASPQPSTTTTKPTVSITVPMPPPTGGIGDIKRGKRFNEAVRLASHVVAPTLVDPRFTAHVGTLILYKEGLIGDGFDSDGQFDKAIERYGFVTGVQTYRQLAGASDPASAPGNVENIVLVFKDDASAAAAVEAGYRLRGEPAGDPSLRAEPTEIPGFPDAKAYMSRTTRDGKVTHIQTTAYLQRGPLVIRLVVAQLPDAERVDLIARYLGRQANALEGFTPTPLGQLKDLKAPFDPEGSIKKMVMEEETVGPTGAGGVFDATGGLLFMSDAQQALDVFNAAGVDRFIGTTTGEAFRVSDESGAPRVLEMMVAILASDNRYAPFDLPAGAPAARCFKETMLTEDPYTRCALSRGRYVVYTGGPLKDIAARVQKQWDRLAG